nr:T9SS type A sorting domain-containing protein [uncultured Dyadobacter sp.]
MLKTSAIALICLGLPLISHAQTIPPLTSSISGIVWEESKPRDDVRTLADKNVAGILVKLLDANTNDVVSTALSGANGEFTLHANAGTYVIEYVYPSDGFSLASQRTGVDNTVNSAADATNFSAQFTVADNEQVNDYGLGLVPNPNTLTYCTQNGSIVTEWNENLLLPKSSVTPVPLNVKLFAAESVYHPMIGVENTGTANAYSISTAGKITMTMPITPANLIMNSDVTIEGNLSDFDGQEDYAGASGATFYNRSSFADAYPARNTSSQSIITSTFVGSAGETFSIPTRAQSTVSFTGAGNLKTAVQTYVNAGACVVYTYEAGALPVKLASFDANREGQVASLSWTTTEELGSDRFEIQRSTDGKQWASIGSVKAVGTTRTLNKYSFSDQDPVNGQNLYRLKMVDLDSTFAYSKMTSLTFAKPLSIYPNPAANTLHVRGVSAEVAQVLIYDLAGRLMKQSVAKAEVDVRSLPQGLYFVKAVYSDGNSSSSSILISR